MLQAAGSMTSVAPSFSSLTQACSSFVSRMSSLQIVADADDPTGRCGSGPGRPRATMVPRGIQATPPPLAPVTRINGGSNARFKRPVLDPAHRGADAGEPVVRPYARLPLRRQRERVSRRAAVRRPDRD